MNQSNRDVEVRVSHEAGERVEARAAWQKPSLRRVSAASAELFAGVANTDGQFTFS